MKRNVILLIFLIQICTGCVNDIPTDCEETDPNATFMSFRSSLITLPSDVDGVDFESITIESLRIMVFSKTTGLIVTNQSFPVGDLSPATYDTNANEWRIDFSHIVVETKPGESIVYVVLNENIMSVSGQTLSGALNMIDNLAEMQVLVNTPLSYTVPLKVVYGTDEKPIEPPFIMSTFDEFDIPAGYTYESPWHADLRGPSESQKGFELDRTMAKVTIDSISSYPIEGAPLPNDSLTSYIFILKMGLTNVPMQYLWSPNRSQTTPPTPNPYTVPVPPYTGSYQYIDFALENSTLGYYDRDWTGNIQMNIDAQAYEVQELKNSRIWYTGLGSGAGSYTLDKYNLDANIASNYNNISKWCFLSSYPDTNNDGIGDPYPIDLNAGNFLAMVQSLYTNPDPTAYLPTWYELIEPYTIVPQMTAAKWSLKEKNISYYVPEHILTNKADPSQATKLHVKAVKAFIPDTISREQSTHIVWNSTTWGNWVYALTPGGTEFSLVGDAFKNMMRTIWGYELDTIQVNNKDTVIVRHYWRGGIRYRYGDVDGTLTGSQFLNILNSTDIKDFYLPVRNTPADPVDFNIYRNHEYKFSVHALEQWDPVIPNSVSRTRNVTDNTGGGSFVLRLNDR